MRTLLNWLILSGICATLTYIALDKSEDNIVLTATFWVSAVIFALTSALYLFLGVVRGLVRFVRSVLGF